MSLPEAQSFPSRVLDPRSLLFVICLVAIGAALALSVLRWDGAVRSYESRFAAAGLDEKAASESPGRIFLDNDAYYWVGYAQEMAAMGSWRIRHTKFDNPPKGRPVHWSQSIAWLLLASGSLRHLATGEALPLAIENAAIWTGPLLYFLLIAGTGTLLFRRLGCVPAVAWMLNLLTILSIHWSFSPMRPDHHGLHLGLVISSLLCLVLGGLGWTSGPEPARAAGPAWFRVLELPDARTARRLFIAAGILGGLGLWTGASVQLFALGLFAAGGVLLVFMMPSPASEPRQDGGGYEPTLWRGWALAGAGTALLFYLIEYAPSFPGMRLEVNHPLYAVSWICIGELLVRLSSAKSRGVRPNGWAVALLGAGALLLPALLVLGPAEWHAMRDPLMQRLHRFIDEFRPYRTAYPAEPWLSAFKDFGLLPAFLVWAPFLAGEKRTTTYEWAALWMALLLSLAYAALTLWQVRWMNFFAGSCLWLAVLVLAVLWRHQVQKGRAAGWFLALLVAIAGQSAYFLHLHLQDIHFRDISRERIGELMSPILQRQFAEKLGALDTDGVFRVMGGPHMAARLHYYGGIPNVASYYWENLDGLRAAAGFFSAENDGEALRIVRERGLTHAVLPVSVELVQMFHVIQHGSYNEAGARASIGGRMLEHPEALPSWIRRDLELERALQGGYLFNGEPVYGTLRVFRIRPESAAAAVPGVAASP